MDDGQLDGNDIANSIANNIFWMSGISENKTFYCN